MIKFAGQFHNFRKTTVGDNLITFSVDGMYSKDIGELVAMNIGTEFIVHLETVNADSDLNKENVEIKERFVRKLHVLLKDLSVIRESSPEEAKKELKAELKKREMIAVSTTELGIKELAIACKIVQDWIKKHD